MVQNTIVTIDDFATPSHHRINSNLPLSNNTLQNDIQNAVSILR
ncbi:14338_t:CDS:2 [Funneliformis caledonium]|uniref:14338_t:CDS:1 n=1 Tax=Funneliformis caledonium TaxID=1117310 RepID=A0A9N9FW00_9GLOM|nr:14338_t:CDS:2 [Funneliformis caledonium]